jgi:hypothetical protein
VSGSHFLYSGSTVEKSPSGHDARLSGQSDGKENDNEVV